MNKLIIGLVLAASVTAPAMLRADDAQVTVVAILATDRDSVIDAKLNQIATEVRKSHPTLTGFRRDRATQKGVTINQKESFALIDDLAAEITVLSREDNEKKVRVTVKTPHAGEVTYRIVGEKYFPIMTTYQDKNKDRLILAVMVKPLPPKPSDKEKDKEKPGEK